jgi:hypothetical protein
MSLSRGSRLALLATEVYLSLMSHGSLTGRGRALLDPKSVPPDITPRVISSVGNYAITISWSDGHSSGIYSFEHLRAIGERDAAKVVEHV